jgi:hypothetical protein
LRTFTRCRRSATTSWLQAAKKEDLEKFLLESVDADKILAKFPAAQKAGKEEKKAGKEAKPAKEDKKAGKEEKGKKVRQYRLVPR